MFAIENVRAGTLNRLHKVGTCHIEMQLLLPLLWFKTILVLNVEVRWKYSHLGLNDRIYKINSIYDKCIS